MQTSFFLGNKVAAITACICALLLLLPDASHAQDAAPAQEAQTEMRKWIATTDTQWQTALKRDVTDRHLTELEKLKQQYVASLEAAVAKASSAGDLDGAVALRSEEKRFAGTNVLPEKDEAGDAASVKQLRAAVRAQIGRLDTDTASRTKALHRKYDQVLGNAQTQLTQRQRLDDALLLQDKRKEVAAAWITPAVIAALENTSPTTQPGVTSKVNENAKPVAADEKRLAESTSKYATDPSIIRQAMVGNWNWIVDGKDNGGWVVFVAGGRFVSAGEPYSWKVSPSGIITVTRSNRQEASLHLSADLDRITGTDFSQKPVKGNRRKN